MDPTRLEVWSPLFALAIAAALNATQLWRARRSAAMIDPAASDSNSPPQPAPVEHPDSLQSPRTRLRRWISGHPVEVVLIGGAISVSVYAWIVSPGFSMDRPYQSWLPGHPYRSLHFVRDMELQAADDLEVAVGIVGTAFSLACCAFSIRRKNLQAARVGLLLAGLSVLGLWQLAMLDFYPVESTAPLALGLLILLAWGLDYRSRAEDDLFGRRLSHIAEILLFSAALVVTILARATFLSLQPYGIEGDELKWTVEVVRSMVDGEFIEATEYHLSSLPVSFYMQALFVRLFGAGILSARLAAVVFSIAAGAAFYALARRLAGARVAWLATFLLGISLLDVSASRLANVESLVKLWPIASLLALAWALDSRRTAGFVAAGALVGLGLLTYDTLAPLLIVGFLLLFYDLHRLRVPRRQAIRFTAAYAAPQLLVLPVAATYWFGRLQYYELGNKGLESGTLERLARYAQELWQALFARAAPDFLYNRHGPLFESLLVPWLLCGALLGLLLWRRGRFAWALVVAALFFLPVPIVTHSPMGRVLYPGLPAAYFFMAVAMVAVYGEVRRLLGDAAAPALLTLAAIGLVQLAILNQYISFNEIEDPEDRRIRRELYDIAAEIQGVGTQGIFPYLPAADDPIESERDYAIWLGMRSRVSRPADMQTPVFPAAPSLLPTLSAMASPEAGVTVVWDASRQLRREERDALLATFLRCYPTAQPEAGEFFDRFTITQEAMSRPECVSALASLELAGGSPEADGQVTFAWQAVGAAPRQAAIVCGRQTPALQVLQAETLSGPGWVVEDRFASDYQGEGFLADPGGSESAAASIEVRTPAPGEYFVWVRTYRRVEDPYGAILGVNGQTAAFGARYDGHPAWRWERLGPFRIDAPIATLSITRPYSGPSDQFIALFFDAIALTSIDSFDPVHDDPYEIVLRQTVPVEPPALAGTVSASLPPGSYACTLTLRDGDRMIDPWGKIGVRSIPVEFEVGEGES